MIENQKGVILLNNYHNLKSITQCRTYIWSQANRQPLTPNPKQIREATNEVYDQTLKTTTRIKDYPNLGQDTSSWTDTWSEESATIAT